MEQAQHSTESTQDYKIQLKDDGLGKYKISPLGYLKDPKETVRISTGKFAKTSNIQFLEKITKHS